MRVNLKWWLLVGSLVLSAQAFASPGGISGRSGMSGTSCTACHSGGVAPAVSFSGPTTVAPGENATVALTISGGQNNKAGLDVAASGGTLVAGAGTYLKSGEITHSSPMAVSGGAAKFTFTWKAPTTPGTYTLYGAGLSANGNGGTSGDMSALAKYVITVSGTTGGTGGGVCTNGATQPCYTGAAATKGVGLCKAGTQTCSGGQWGACTGQVLPAAEKCDGFDNSCDGRIDEGCPSMCSTGQTQTCYSGPTGTQNVGACHGGKQSCSSGTWLACSGEVVPSAEICGNGVDDDCNGQVDDGCAPSTMICTSGDTRLCYAGPEGTEGVGSCRAGAQTCVNGAWGVCEGAVTPAAETCGDSADNDCNGTVDDGCTGSNTTSNAPMDPVPAPAAPLPVGQGCSTSGAAGALPLLAAAGLLTLLRRRKRA